MPRQEDEPKPWLTRHSTTWRKADMRAGGMPMGTEGIQPALTNSLQCFFELVSMNKKSTKRVFSQ